MGKLYRNKFQSLWEWFERVKQQQTIERTSSTERLITRFLRLVNKTIAV